MPALPSWRRVYRAVLQVAAVSLSAAAEQADPLIITEESVATAISQLHSTCTAKSAGWWTYEVCHLETVKQYL